MECQDVLADYAQRMSPSEADHFLGLRNGTVSSAIRRGEIEPYVFDSRCKVTPAMLAEWLTTHCKRNMGATAATATPS